ncbi:MAG: hypothetical protein LBC59_07115 [Chitinispirillales bacterium]|jgi:uncharacterized protein (TIGR02145 family)|nr:hypothetical protein [Chitinispirillales bacterium]
MRDITKFGRTLLLTAAMAAVWLGCGGGDGCECGDGDNIVSNATYTLQISITPMDGGTVSREPEKSAYSNGERVTVRATPASGYRFVSWSGVSTSTNAEVTVTMSANLALTANFLQQGVTDHVHDWGDWVVTVPATCEAAGVETRTCRTDGSHKETRAIAKLTGSACNPGGGSSETVTLGGLKWMTKNLDVETADSWCYDNSPDSCAKYGRLYTWEAAKSACQLVGMRLPTRAEWDALETAAGGSSVAGSKLRTSIGWNYSTTVGTDEFGFSALPGGYRPSGSFVTAGNHGTWWTATEDSDGFAYTRWINSGFDYVGELPYPKSDGFSARCVE